MKPSIVNAGADAVIVYFADEISIEANQRVLQLDSAIASSDLAILETVPAYSSLMVITILPDIQIPIYVPRSKLSLSPCLNSNRLTRSRGKHTSFLFITTRRSGLI